MTHPLRTARLALLLCPLLLPDAARAQTAKFTQDGITLRQDPALPTDAARKGYVDSLVGTAAAAAATAQAAANAAVPQSALGQPNGPARLGPGGTLPATQLPVGTAVGTVAAGNDPRIIGAVQAGSLAPVAATGNYADLAGRPVLAPVAATGAFSDLTGKPAIPPAPTAGTVAGTFAAGNDGRIAGAAQAASLSAVATSEAYSDLLGRPATPVVPPFGTAGGTIAAGNDPRITGAAQAASLAAVATSGNYTDLAGRLAIPAVPAFGTTAGTAAAGNDARIPVVGNQAAAVGAMRIDLGLLAAPGFPLQAEGGIWPGVAQTYVGVDRLFTSADPGTAGAPAIGLLSRATNGGTPSDVVALMGTGVVRANGGTAFGGNLIARTGGGTSGAKLVGLEIDVQPVATDTALSSAGGGLFINGYSMTLPIPAIQLGGLGGGTFRNGFECAAVASTGSCLAPVAGAAPGRMMDSSQATLADAAIRIGWAGGTGANGPGQRIAFRQKDGTDSVITTDANNYLKVTTGSGGLVVSNQPQTANLLLLTAANGNLTLPVPTAQVVGTGDLNLTATTGQVNLAAGLRLPTRTVTAGASDTAGAADYTVKWQKAAGSASAQAIPACVAAARGRVLRVKDGKGDAAANPITVTPAAGTVDGAANVVVGTGRGAVTLQCDGAGDWSVLARM